MHWWARKPQLSVNWNAAQTYELVCAMAYKVYAAFIASLGVALTLASSESFGRSGAANAGRSASTPSTSHRSVARSLHHHHGRNTGAFWPAAGGFFYNPPSAEPKVDISEPQSGDVHYTCTYDIPWDWAHRCPPFVSSSEPPSAPVVRAYVPGCPAQTVTVPLGDGKEQTVNIVRCY
jgi:hypothetical protein